MVLEPGPAQPSTMPLAPRVVTPGTFTRIGASVIATLQGADDALRGTMAVIAPFANRELGSGYNVDVAPAAASVDAIDDPAEAATVAEIGGGLGYVADTATAERSVLPFPDQQEPADQLDENIAPEPDQPVDAEPPPPPPES